MCGIVGLYSWKNNGFDQKDIDLVQQMLYLDAFRGMDSTGVYSVHLKNQVRWLKQAAPSYIFLANPAWKKYKEALFKDAKLLVGHNRKATIGKVSNETAHPFVEDHIVLVHNGTVYDADTHTERDVDVDSHAITCAIAEKGYKEVLSTLNGAWALVWYDAKVGKLHLVRNNQRPLAVAKTDIGIVWMSEKDMLQYVLERNKVKINSIEELEPLKLITIARNNQIQEETIVKKYQSSTSYPTGGSSSYNHSHHGSTGQSTSTSSQKKTDDKSSTGQGSTTTSRSNSSTLEKERENARNNPALKGFYDEGYSVGQLVCFAPDKLHAPDPNKEDSRWKLEGQMYLPGRDAFDGVMFFPKGTAGDVPKFMAAQRSISATISHVSYRTNDDMVFAYLNQPVKPAEFRDYDGNKVTATELEEICDIYKCDNCGSGLDLHTPDKQVFQQDEQYIGLFKTLCAKCVTKSNEALASLTGENSDDASNQEVIDRTVPAILR